MSLSSVLIYIILLLYCIIVFVLYVNAKTVRTKIIYSILMASVLAILAYYFVPRENYDLVTHHDIAERLSKATSPNNLFSMIGKIDLEIIPQLFEFVVGKTGDLNLLQAAIVLIGYGVLFYILIDYKNKVQLSSLRFVAIMCLVVFAQHMLYYFSGLYNYLAINLFSLAIYLDYVKEKKKQAWLLYIITLFIHNSLFLPLFIILIYKIKRERISIPFSVVFTIILFGFSAIMHFIATNFASGFIGIIAGTYDRYVIKNETRIVLYDGMYLFMSVVKISVALFACWLQKNNNKNRHLRDITWLIAISTILLSFSSIAMTRFSSLVLFVSIPVIFDLLKQKSYVSRYFFLLICVFSIIFLVYTAWAIFPHISIGGEI